MVRREILVACAAWSLVVGCSVREQPAATPVSVTEPLDTGPSVTSALNSERGSACFAGTGLQVSDVLVQVGDYELATNIDGFVSGPALVVYFDGQFAATLTTTSPEWTEELVCGRLTDDDLDDVLAETTALPSGPVDTGTIAVDLDPTLLVAGERRWALNDPTTDPFGGFIQELNELIESRATDWTPGAWVIVDEAYDERCTISTVPSPLAYLDAPVYPHLGELRGDIACDAIRNTLVPLTTSRDCWIDSMIAARPLPAIIDIPSAPDDNQTGDRNNFGEGTVGQLYGQLIGVPGNDAARALSDAGWTVTLDEWSGAPPTFTPDLLWTRITLRTCQGIVVDIVFD